MIDGDLRFEDEKARLDNFAIHLSEEPLATGYILLSAGRETYKGEARERLDRARSYLIRVRGVDQNRLVTVDCGFSTDLTFRLYIAPAWMAIPGCINSDVQLTEVKFTKRRPKSSKKTRLMYGRRRSGAASSGHWHVSSFIEELPRSSQPQFVVFRRLR